MTLEKESNKSIKEGERRVSNVRINGKKLSENKTYSCSLSENITDGNDGYSMLSSYKIENKTSKVWKDNLTSYLNNNLKGNELETSKSVQERIKYDRNPKVIKVKEDNINSECSKINNEEHFTFNLSSNLRDSIKITHLPFLYALLNQKPTAQLIKTTKILLHI